MADMTRLRRYLLSFIFSIILLSNNGLVTGATDDDMIVDTPPIEESIPNNDLTENHNE